jgi:hypothetical protein
VVASKTKLETLITYGCLRFSQPPIQHTVVPFLRFDMLHTFVMRRVCVCRERRLLAVMCVLPSVRSVCVSSALTGRIFVM